MRVEDHPLHTIFEFPVWKGVRIFGIAITLFALIMVTTFIMEVESVGWDLGLIQMVDGYTEEPLGRAGNIYST